MKKSARLMLIAGVSLAAVLDASWEYRSYARKSAELEQEIQRYTKGLADRDEKMADKARISRDLKKIAQTTLGADEEKVTAALRKALNEVAFHYKLADASVTSARPSALKNPASQRGVGELGDKKWKGAKSAPDFYILPATINAKCTLDQALRTMATLEAQPWVHKIDSFSIRPIGKERERVEVTISLGTLYLTDAVGSGLRPGESVSWSPASEAQYASWQPLAAKNVFKEPAAPVAAAPTPAQPTATVAALPPPPPPGPAYDQWRVSGITRGAGGPELMVVNSATKQWISLVIGGVVLDAKFLDASGETARISIGDKEFEVKTGQTFAERTPVAR